MMSDIQQNHCTDSIYVLLSTNKII